MLRHISGPRAMWRTCTWYGADFLYPPIKLYLGKVHFQSKLLTVNKNNYIRAPFFGCYLVIYIYICEVYPATYIKISFYQNILAQLIEVL